MMLAKPENILLLYYNRCLCEYGDALHGIDWPVETNSLSGPEGHRFMSFA